MLEDLIPQVLVGEIQHSPDLVVDGARQTDLASSCQVLQSSGNVDAVSVNPLAIDAHVAHMGADAKLHSTLGFDPCVPDTDGFLKLDGAIDRVYGARELGQEVVATEVDHSAAKTGHELGHCLSMLGQRADRVILVLRHQADGRSVSD